MRARHREFRQVRWLLERLPRPLLVVPGNHDVPLVSPERLRTPYGRYESWIDASPRPVANVLGLTALGLRTMPWWRWKSGFVSARQSREVVRVLGGAPEDDVRMLALHHPPFATGAAALVGRGRLARALAEARVDVVLAGHTHVPEVQNVDGRPLVVIAGTATSLRTRKVPRSWSQVRIAADTIEVHERYASDDGTWHTGRVVRQSDGRRLRAGRRPRA
jgi:3',5'-cyclic AMP phosphodiesterase CpdA